jgi:hypothetical protein
MRRDYAGPAGISCREGIERVDCRKVDKHHGSLGGYTNFFNEVVPACGVHRDGGLRISGSCISSVTGFALSPGETVR